MAASLFEHETISTTQEKAKEVRRFAEKLITLARNGTLHARRRAIATLGNRAVYAEEDGELAQKGTIIGKLFSDIAPRYLDRPGGYTRIIRLSKFRLGDNSRLVLLQLVGAEEKEKPAAKKKKKKPKAS
jgi:large subunit ribosomal protein L17